MSFYIYNMITYFVVLIFFQQSLLLVNSIELNNKLLHPLPSYEVGIKTSNLQRSVDKENNPETIKSPPRDTLCPASEDISPCVCIGEYSPLSMDCSNVTTEYQLRRIFTSHFPVTHFYMFNTFESPLTVLESGVFGEVTFTHFKMEYGSLIQVENGALDNMYDTLEELWLVENHIEVFPFEAIESFTKLKILSIQNNWEHMSVLPVMVSGSLIELYLGKLTLGAVPVDAFQGLPMIERIYLYSDKIPSIESGTFSHLTHLRVLDLSGNLLTHIPTEFVHSSDGLNNLTSIRLSNNQIEAVEAKAFDAVAGVGIHLFGNNIATIDEEVWKPLFEVGLELDLSSNPLLCGCDIAWVVRNPGYLVQIKRAVKCADGVYLHDLDPHMFNDC
ncbi:unnamed protein product [Meganyctiphanes norvegica]|uniref:Oplophorus-luciferin 2-monooxygenase non-catalytic subunit n=1 Tax=Meganyctiphanes norvegica TaxID=48144 RepID=A0AAV2RK72_MEGNR